MKVKIDAEHSILVVVTPSFIDFKVAGRVKDPKNGPMQSLLTIHVQFIVEILD